MEVMREENGPTLVRGLQELNNLGFVLPAPSKLSPNRYCNSDRRISGPPCHFLLLISHFPRFLSGFLAIGIRFAIPAIDFTTPGMDF